MMGRRTAVNVNFAVISKTIIRTCVSLLKEHATTDRQQCVQWYTNPCVEMIDKRIATHVPSVQRVHVAKTIPKGNVPSVFVPNNLISNTFAQNVNCLMNKNKYYSVEKLLVVNWCVFIRFWSQSIASESLRLRNIQVELIFSIAIYRLHQTVYQLAIVPSSIAFYSAKWSTHWEVPDLNRQYRVFVFFRKRWTIRKQTLSLIVFAMHLHGQPILGWLQH